MRNFNSLQINDQVFVIIDNFNEADVHVETLTVNTRAEFIGNIVKYTFDNPNYILVIEDEERNNTDLTQDGIYYTLNPSQANRVATIRQRGYIDMINKMIDKLEHTKNLLYKNFKTYEN